VVETEDAPSFSLKRKGSSDHPTADADSTSPKRARLDSTNNDRNGSAGSPVAPKDQNQDRRPRNAREEEKKRGRRLFGGLLNTLSRTTSNTSSQKKRQDIERRQARVQQQRVEDDKHREEKLAKLKRVRLVEQVRYDEQVVRPPCTIHTLYTEMACSLTRRTDANTAFQSSCSGSFSSDQR
jgi:ABC-type phosphate transport system auxiliary subunit